MEDFEVHPRGALRTYMEEVKLSRELARAVHDASTQFDLPLQVLEALAKLQSLYDRQIQEGEM